MNARPERLARELHVHRRELVLLNATNYAPAQKGKRLHSRRRLATGLFLVAMQAGRHWHHESSPVVVGVFKTEFNVGQKAALQALQRVRDLFFDPAETFDQAGKGLAADILEQLGFVLKVEVDGCGRVFDPVRDAAHRNIFVALADEKLACGAQNLLPQEIFLPGSPLMNAHVENASLT